jgi:hypothetical protein
MKRAIALSLLLASCTIVVDDDNPNPEPWTTFASSADGGTTGSQDGEPDEVGEFACKAPGDADYITWEVECSSDIYILCEAGDFLPAEYAAGRACCQGDWAGAGCMLSAVETCDGLPMECPNGGHWHPPCPDGLIEMCDYGYD